MVGIGHDGSGSCSFKQGPCDDPDERDHYIPDNDRREHQIARELAAGAKSLLAKCEHHEVALKRRVVAGGSVQVVHQCAFCGRSVGGPVKQYGIDVSALPKFDDDALRRTHCIEAQARHQARKQWWSEYERYMASDEWARVRAKVLTRSPVCEACGEAASTQVHHYVYAHFGCELLWELAGVCDACHRRVHSRDERRQEEAWWDE